MERRLQLVSLILLNNVAKAFSGEYFIALPSPDLPGLNSAELSARISPRPSADAPAFAHVQIYSNHDPTSPCNTEGDFSKDLISVVPLNCDIFLTEMGISNRVLRVTSDHDIDLHFVISSSGNEERFLAIPLEGLGFEYIVATFCTFGGTCQFSVAAATQAESTEIRIEFPKINHNISFCFNDEPVVAQFENLLTLTLGPEEVLYVESSGDLTGTIINSTAIIAVFSGSREVPTSNSIPSFMIEQLLPVNKWGKDFIVASGPQSEGDLVRIFASNDGTTVAMTGFSDVYLQLTGSYVQKRLDRKYLGRITANKPIMVVQFSSIDVYNTGIVDVPPSMLFIQSTEHYVDRAFRVDCTIGYLTLIVESGNEGELTINNEDISSQVDATWIKVRETDLAVTQVDVTPKEYTGSILVQILDPLLPTKLVASVVHCKEKGHQTTYIATMDFEVDTDEACRPSTMVHGDGVDNDCDGDVDEDDCTVIDEATAGKLSGSFGSDSYFQAVTVPVDGVSFVTFRLQTCSMALVTLTEDGGDFASVYISTASISVSMCYPDCELSATGTSAVAVLCENLISYKITWSSGTIFVAQGGQVVTRIDRPGHNWRFASMNATTLMGSGTIEIDVSTKDCSRQAIGIPDTNGKEFVIYAPFDTKEIYITATEHDVDIELSPLGVVSIMGVIAKVYNVKQQESLRVSNPVGNRFRISASNDAELYVSVLMEDTANFLAAGYTAIPTDVLGTRYVVVSNCTSTNCACAIHTLDARAFLTITIPDREPAINLEYDPSNFDGNMEAYSLLNIHSTVDLTGLYLESTKPVALFCGEYSDVALSVDQIPPIGTLGSEFHVPVVGLPGSSSQMLRLVAVSDSTYVRLHDDFRQHYFLEYRGDYTDVTVAVEASTTIYHVISNKPIIISVFTDVDSHWTGKIIPAVSQFARANIVPGFVSNVVVRDVRGVDVHGNENPVLENTERYNDFIYTNSNASTFFISVDRIGMFGLILAYMNDIPLLLHAGMNLALSIPTECAHSNGVATDGNDNDCDNVEDEEYCYATPTLGFVDFDMDGGFNEDCFCEADVTSSVAPLCTTSDMTTSTELLPTPTVSSNLHTSPTQTVSSNLHTSPTPAIASNLHTSAPSGVCETSTITAVCSHDVTTVGMTSSAISPTYASASASSPSTTSESKTALTASEESTPPNIVPTSTLITASSSVCMKPCSCPCAWFTNQNITYEELQEIIKKIEEELILDKKTLGASIRKKESIYEDRPTSKGIGYVGIIILVTLFGSILVIDSTTLYRELKRFWSNMTSVKAKRNSVSSA